MPIYYDEMPPLPPGWLRVSEHRERWEKLRLKAQETARGVARLLIDEYGAKRVWLIGSAAGVWVFHDYSDVDIIADRPDDDVFTRAWSRFYMWEGFRIDLRTRDMFKDDDWARLIPEPVLLAKRPEIESDASKIPAPRARPR